MRLGLKALNLHDVGEIYAIIANGTELHKMFALFQWTMLPRSTSVARQPNGSQDLYLQVANQMTWRNQIRRFHIPGTTVRLPKSEKEP